MKLVVMQFGSFTVMSYGNGTAYDVQRNGEHFFIQGDDAARFHDECEQSGWEATCSGYMYSLGELYA